jgi:hypothetical protein
MDLSHLAAVALGAFLRVIFAPLKSIVWDKVWPALVDHNNRNSRIAGTWRIAHSGCPSDGESLEAAWTVEVSLSQIASKVNGKATANCIEGASKGKIVHYSVRGTYASSILDVTLYDADRVFRNRSTFLLQVVGDGSTLDGHRLFLGRNKNNVRSIPCKWHKGESLQSGCGTA